MRGGAWGRQDGRVTEVNRSELDGATEAATESDERRWRREPARRRRRPLHRPAARDRAPGRRLRRPRRGRRRAGPRGAQRALPRARPGRRDDAEHGRLRAHPPLRQDRRTATVSVIMLTARGLSADKLEGFSIGADDYIVKPFDTPELLARIRGVLRRATRDAHPIAAHRTAGQRARSRRRSRLACAGRQPVRDPLRGPRPLQGVQRPLRIHAGRRGDPVHRADDQEVARGARRRRRSSATWGATTSSWCAARSRPRRRPGDRGSAFDEAVAGALRRRDRERGYIEVTNRRGELQRFPLLSVSIGIATHRQAVVPHYAEAVAVATEMKAFTKTSAGSSWAWTAEPTRHAAGSSWGPWTAEPTRHAAGSSWGP